MTTIFDDAREIIDTLEQRDNTIRAQVNSLAAQVPSRDLVIALESRVKNLTEELTLARAHLHASEHRKATEIQALEKRLESAEARILEPGARTYAVPEKGGIEQLRDLLWNYGPGVQRLENAQYRGEGSSSEELMWMLWKILDLRKP